MIAAQTTAPDRAKHNICFCFIEAFTLNRNENDVDGFTIERYMQRLRTDIQFGASFIHLVCIHSRTFQNGKMSVSPKHTKPRLNYFEAVRDGSVLCFWLTLDSIEYGFIWLGCCFVAIRKNTPKYRGTLWNHIQHANA